MSKSDWYSKNKAKAWSDNKAWREANQEYDRERKRKWYHERGRERDLKKLYDLSMDEYSEMLVKQNYKCAICDSEGKLNVDHNHTTGKVRGLLCYDCNRNFIGKHESPEKFIRASKYLA